MRGRHIFEAIEKSDKFPKMPKELSDIVNMIQVPEETDIDELADRIKNVVDLESMIMDFINSEFFKAPKKVTSLKEAIIFLGMNTMQVIIVAQIVNCLFPKEDPESCTYQKICYLKHTVGTAVAATALSEWLGEESRSDKYELFAYGVLHDIGVVLYEVCLPDMVDKVQDIIIRGNHPVVAERIAFGGIDHTDIGAWFCRKLNFPPNIVDIIENHHWPKKSTNINKIMYIISVADYISHLYYRDFLIKKKVEKPIKIYMPPNPLNIPHEVIDEILCRLPGLVDETLRLFKRF